MKAEGVIVVIPGELETGFRLAGVETLTAESAQDASEALDSLLDESIHGVIAVYEPFLAQVSPEKLGAYEALVAPVVVPLPAGLEERDEASHQARISAMLSRAIGYHITFGEEISR